MYFTVYFCLFILTTSFTLSNEIRLTSASLGSIPAEQNRQEPPTTRMSWKLREAENRSLKSWKRAWWDFQNYSENLMAATTVSSMLLPRLYWENTQNVAFNERQIEYIHIDFSN